MQKNNPTVFHSWEYFIYIPCLPNYTEHGFESFINAAVKMLFDNINNNYKLTSFLFAIARRFQLLMTMINITKSIVSFSLKWVLTS